MTTDGGQFARHCAVHQRRDYSVDAGKHLLSESHLLARSVVLQRVNNGCRHGFRQVFANLEFGVHRRRRSIRRHPVGHRHWQTPPAATLVAGSADHPGIGVVIAAPGGGWPIAAICTSILRSANERLCKVGLLGQKCTPVVGLLAWTDCAHFTALSMGVPIDRVREHARLRPSLQSARKSENHRRRYPSTLGLDAAQRYG